MNPDQLYESALKSIRKPQQSPKRLLQSLVAIRNCINSSKHIEKIRKLQRDGCLKILIDCLKDEDTNVEIINVTLSIIGNSCLDSSVAKEIIKKYQILPVLCALFNKHDVDSIRGRLFRVIGNLCDGWNSCTVIERAPQVIHIFELFFRNLYSENDCADSKISEATIVMALRASRKILKKNTARVIICEERILVGIGLMLLKYTEIWLKDNTKSIILDDILKVLQLYSTYSFKEVVLQLQSTEGGDALVCLSQLLTLNTVRVLKIIMNLTTFCPNKSDLPILTVMTKLTSLAVETRDCHPNAHERYLRALSKLLDHPGHRQYVLEAGSISTLMTLFKSYKSPTRHTVQCLNVIISFMQKLVMIGLTPDIVVTLTSQLVQEVMSHGFMTAVIEKLRWYVGASERVSVYRHDVKLMDAIGGMNSMGSPQKRQQCTNIQINSVSEVTKFNIRGIASPERSISPSNSSQISSHGPYSPQLQNYIIDDMSDSNDYSPVCSDVEDLMDIESESEDILTKYDKDLQNSLTELTTNINTVLYAFCILFPTELANVELLTVLINGAFRHNEAVLKTIKTIIESKDTLLTLMQSTFFPEVYDVIAMSHNNCKICEKAAAYSRCIIAFCNFLSDQSVFRGELYHHMIKSSDEIREKLVLVIPYVIGNRSIIKKTLLTYTGCEVLLRLLQSPSNPLRHRAVKALNTLAQRHLRIKSPRNYDRYKSTGDNCCCGNTVKLYYTSPSSDDDVSLVTFVLDDGGRVTADRTMLVEKSDFFNGLLNGDFVEATQSEIRLQNVATSSLHLLLNLITYHYSSSNSFSHSSAISAPLEVILDVILLADRYLLQPLAMAVSSHVEQHLITAATVGDIYRWSVTSSGTDLLRVECVAYLLAESNSGDDNTVVNNSCGNMSSVASFTNNSIASSTNNSVVSSTNNSIASSGNNSVASCGNKNSVVSSTKNSVGNCGNKNSVGNCSNKNNVGSCDKYCTKNSVASYCKMMTEREIQCERVRTLEEMLIDFEGMLVGDIEQVVGRYVRNISGGASDS